MYGTYIYLQNWVISRANVGKYSINGAYGNDWGLTKQTLDAKPIRATRSGFTQPRKQTSDVWRLGNPQQMWPTWTGCSGGMTGNAFAIPKEPGLDFFWTLTEDKLLTVCDINWLECVAFMVMNVSF